MATHKEIAKTLSLWIAVFILFILTSAILVFFASGYKYDLASHQIVKTGIISISSQPKGADLYLDNKLSNRETPAKFSHLLPGIYHITLRKSGYQTWEKDVTVKAELVTQLKDVTLFYDQPKQTILSSKITNFQFSQDKSKAILYQENDLNHKILLFQANNGQTTELLSLPATSQLKSIHWRNDNKLVLISTQSTNNTNYYLIDTSSNQITSLTNQFNLQFSLVDFLNNGNLVALAGSNLYQISGATISEKIAQISYAYVSLDYIFLIQDSANQKNLVRLNHSFGEQTNILNLAKTENYQLYSLIKPANQLFVIDSAQNLYMLQNNDNFYQLIQIGSNINHLSSLENRGLIASFFGANKVLYQSDYELFELNPSDLTSNILITRLSSTIVNPIYLPNQKYLVYITNNEVKIIGTDGINNLKLDDTDQNLLDTSADGSQIFYLYHQRFTKAQIN